MKQQTAKDLFHRVIDLLEQYPHYRKDDRALCTHIWREELHMQQKTLFPSAYDFIGLYENKKIPSEGSITRLARMAKNQHPHLDPKKQEQKEAEEEKVKQDLTEITT